MSSFAPTQWAKYTPSFHSFKPSPKIPFYSVRKFSKIFENLKTLNLVLDMIKQPSWAKVVQEFSKSEQTWIFEELLKKLICIICAFWVGVAGANGTKTTWRHCSLIGYYNISKGHQNLGGPSSEAFLLRNIGICIKFLCGLKLFILQTRMSVFICCFFYYKEIH